MSADDVDARARAVVDEIERMNGTMRMDKRSDAEDIVARALRAERERCARDIHVALGECEADATERAARIAQSTGDEYGAFTLEHAAACVIARRVRAGEGGGT